MRALTFSAFGGPEVLEYRDVPDPEVPPGHALVRLQAIGLNFADVYRRRGAYHLAGSPPYIAGYEGAGTVVGLGASEAALPVEIGDRVGFADSPYANAELVAVPIDKLIPLPDDISFETAAALLLQGLTAQYLVRDSYPVAAGDDVLIHAAAGGVGLLLVQIARQLGARVFALASTEEKRQAALDAGAKEAFASSGDWVTAARAWSKRGAGVDVVYDSVGSTLDESLQAARTGGHVVFYGMAGGDPQLVDPRRLMDESKTLTGGDLWNVLTDRAERIRRADELFSWVRDGSLHVRIAERFPLSEGARAHAFLESRRSIGKVIFLP
jgi:NADPH2:quinone reductase